MKKYHPFIKIWLIIGCVMLFMQIIIGGVTRITGSGLSITKWEIVTGTLPPINEDDWIKEFDLYKATPQYEKINEGMSMSDFKFIYFWEYFHRLWARIMGFVFLFPFLFFVFKGYLDRRLIKLLTGVFCFAMLAAVFGWIMVASGLVDRPWVNAYKLSIHLSIALITFGFLLWATFTALQVDELGFKFNQAKNTWLLLFIVVCFQLYLGGIMSGTRASLAYPNWPDINGSIIPEAIFSIKNYSWSDFVNYDRNGFVPLFFHFLHRSVGYLLFGIGVFFSVREILYGFGIVKSASVCLIILLIIQVILGICTLLNSKGTIPVGYGVFHQAFAILIYCNALFLVYLSRHQTNY